MAALEQSPLCTFPCTWIPARVWPRAIDRVTLQDRTVLLASIRLPLQETPGMNVSEVATVARFTVDCLDVLVYENRALAGRAAAQAVAASIAAAQHNSGNARVVFAAAPSQDEFMAGLVADKTSTGRASSLSTWTNTWASTPTTRRRSAGTFKNTSSAWSA